MIAPNSASPDPVEELEIELLLEALVQRFGYDFRGFRRQPLAQKLCRLKREARVGTISALQDRALHEPMFAQHMLDALVGRPTALFEGPRHYAALREMVCPLLRSCPSPRIWLANCASAEQAYGIAILLVQEGLYERSQVFVTTPSESLLQLARAGRFDGERLREYEENHRASGATDALQRYCLENGRSVGGMCFRPELGRNITWAQYNLVTDASFNEFDLIICRGTLEDFGVPLRRRVMRLFDDSLSLFGVVSLDEPDALQQSGLHACYEPLHPQAGLYRKVVSRPE